MKTLFKIILENNLVPTLFPTYELARVVGAI